MSQLKVTIKAGSKKQIKEISESYFSIGRAGENQITIIHSGISRKHLEVELEGYLIKLTDTGSTNGTKVNGEKLEPKVPFTYRPGDKIELGTCPATLFIDLIAQEEDEEEVDECMSSSEKSSNFCNWSDFGDFPEEKLGEDRESSSIKMEMDVPGGGRIFDFEEGEEGKDLKLNLEVSLGLGNDAFVEIKNQCTIGAAEEVDFRVEDKSINPHHATFFQKDKSLIMVLHVAKATFRRKRLKEGIKYILNKGVVFHLGDLSVKVVEGKTLLLKKLDAKGIRGLLKETDSANDSEEATSSSSDDERQLLIDRIKKFLKKFIMIIFHYVTFDIFKTRFEMYENDEDSEDEDSEDEDSEDEDSEDEDSEDKSLYKRLKNIFSKSDHKKSLSKQDEEEDEEEEIFAENDFVAGVIPRIIATIYDIGFAFLLLKAIGKVDLGVSGFLEGVDSRLANYSDLILIFFCLQFLGTLLFGVTTGQLMMSLGQKTQKRLLGVVRLLLGYLLLPFIIFDIVLFRKRPSLKEKISGSRIILASSVRSFMGLLLLIPLLFMGNLLIPIYKNRDALQSEQQVRQGKIEAGDLLASTEYQSNAFGLKVTSGIETINITPYLFIENKKVKLYLLDLNSYGYYKITRTDGLKLHEFIPKFGKGNPLLFLKFPALAKRIQLGIPKEYEFSSSELEEFVLFVKVCMGLSIKTLQAHVLKHGPFIDAFIEFRKVIMTILGEELPPVIDIVKIGKDSYLRFSLKRDRENVKEVFISLTRRDEISFSFETEKNPKAIFMQNLIYRNFLYQIQWKERGSIVVDYSQIVWNRFNLVDFMMKYQNVPQGRRDQILEFVLRDLRGLIQNRNMESSADRAFFKLFFSERIKNYKDWLQIKEDESYYSYFNFLEQQL